MALPANTEQPDADYEVDMDSLHVLPLSIIPFETPALGRARLIKNYNFQSVIEVWKDSEGASGQLDPSQLGKMFNWTGAQGYEDQRIIDGLSGLHSYDVYSLRMELRRLGIEVNDHEELRLSEAKQAELTNYMRSFTSPLMSHVYGDSNMEIKDFDQLVGMFANPDKELAIRNLKKLAERLNIEVFAVPAFLEEYADIFMSLAYYRQCLDELVPKVTQFFEMSNELRGSLQMRRDMDLMKAGVELHHRLNDITASLTGRFESFERNSQTMWENLTAESFRKVRNLIESHHTTVGGTLCGLTVKMSIWDEQVKGRRGGLMERAEFIMTHMRPGMDKIKEIEDSAPSITDL